MEGADEVRLARLALEPACPESVLTTFANGPSAALRAAAARNPRLNLGLLSMLAQNTQETEAVLLAVAEHPFTSRESLQRLAGSRYPAVRIAAALHPAAPLDALLLLAGASDISVQLALTARASLPAEVQRALLTAGSSEVLQALAGSPFAVEDILSALAASEDPDIRLRVAVHPNLAAGQRQVLSTDRDWRVRQAASAVLGEEAIVQAPVDDATYLNFLTSEQEQERQDLMQALEALNSEALGLARQRWLASLDRPRTVDEQRLRAAHQGRVLELERESRLALERDLRILRQNLQAEAEREKRGTSLSLSKALELERQALREELKTQRARQVLEEQTASERRRMEELSALRAQQATDQQQILTAERAQLTLELERFLADQRAQLQAEAKERLQVIRTGLEQKLQTELATLRERLEVQSLSDLAALRVLEEERTTARKLELEAALERLLGDQVAQLQAEAKERWTREGEVFRQAAEARQAEMEVQAQAIRQERLSAEQTRRRAELEVQGEAQLQEWRRISEEVFGHRQAEWEAETKRAQADLARFLDEEHERRLEEQRLHLETEFAATGRARLEQLRQISEADLQQQRHQASSELTAALAEQRRQLEAELQRQLEQLLAEHEASADAREAELAAQLVEWRQQGDAARDNLRAEGRRTLVSEVSALKTALAAEQQQKLEVRRRQLEAEFEEDARVQRERQRQASHALEAQLRQQMGDQLEAEWPAREAALRASHVAALTRELEHLAEQALAQQQAVSVPDPESRFELRAEQFTAELAQQRQEALAARQLISDQQPVTILPLTSPTDTPNMVGTLIGGYLVPAELLPANPEPVLQALRLILTHLDVQEAALARLTPDGQSRRSFLRAVDRVIESFVHAQENIILRADREDGPHYFCNERVPRLTP
ncbi:hypothetical protein Q0M94_06375 [Deinococcus radiomollis]|uniref:hypothetical protein n=1 Tax=Deinococcus radiomollis TaxID=468916 RepID=UPI003891EBAE